MSALIRASLEGAVLVAAIWSVARLWPRLSAGALTVLWWCAAAKFLLAIVWVTPVEVRILPAAVAAPSAVSLDRPVTADHALPESPRRGPDTPASAFSWTVVIGAAWLAGAVLALWLAGRRWWVLSGVVARAAAASPEIVLMATHVASSLGLRRAPPVRISRDVQTPLVMGLLRPTVVLPAGRFDGLTACQQRMALCHELAHVKRGDLWFGCVPALAERIFFFHPLVRLAAREYALCREAACDATVLNTLDSSPQEYGRLLLALGVTPGRTAAAAAGAPWSFSTLKRRITMLREPSTHTLTARTAAALAVAAAALAIVPLRLAARPAPATGTAERTALRETAQTPRKTAPDWRDVQYVLFLDEDSTHSSGTSADMRAARRLRRGNERLMWFRHGSEEYVVRDAGVLDQVLAIWLPVGVIGEEQGKLGERQGSIGARQGEIGVRQGRIGAEQGAIGAKQGALGTRQATLGMRQMVALSDAGKSAIDAEYRKIDDEMRALDREMRELDVRMRELEKPMDDLNGEMEGLNREMHVLSRKMDEASAQARTEMAALLDRVVATGAAQPVK